MEKIINYKCNYISGVYKLLQPFRYYLAFYLSGPTTFIGGELFIILKNQKALLDFKYSYFEDIKKIKKNILVKPIHITGDIKHAAVLILDLKNKTFEYFDPEGYPIWYDDILSSINTFIKYFAPGFKYKSSTTVCAPGKLKEEICSDWALLYLYLKSNDLEINLFKYNINKLINQWECYLWDIVNQGLNQILVGDVVLKMKLPAEEYMKIMNTVYNFISEKNIKEAVNFIRNELDRLGVKYFNELVSEYFPKFKL